MDEIADPNFELVRPTPPRRPEARPIDDLLPHAPWFWRSLERACVAGCCGLDAFDFSAESVRAACGDEVTLAPYMNTWNDPDPGDPIALAIELRRSAAVIRTLDDHRASVSRLNAIEPPTFFAELFDELAAHLEAAPTRQQRPGPPA